MPKRSFENVEEFEEHFADADEVLIDGTENMCFRPKDNDNQRLKYSGKKGTHTDIALVFTDKRRYIYYLSRLYEGSNVDFALLKAEFPPSKDWFRDQKVVIDLGFVGIEKEYKMKEVLIGFKRARKSKANPTPTLTKEQKEWNGTVSRERIYVEHAIGGMKKYRILKNRCRIKCQCLKNEIIGICAGLWNYQLLLTT
jgi:DDE superfamily endonuclease